MSLNKNRKDRVRLASRALTRNTIPRTDLKYEDGFVTTWQE